MIRDIELYNNIFSNIISGKEVKIIAKELNTSYLLVWKIKNNFEYFYSIYVDISKKEISSDFNNSDNVYE